jgi:DUF971 family protein
LVADNRSFVRPADIVCDPEAGLLRILWQDEHESVYELPALRPKCPCALCHGEMGRPGLVTDDTQFSAEQCTLVSIHEVGRYALQPVWGDGHDSGFFTFVLLRSLCPCPGCATEHASGQHK